MPDVSWNLRYSTFGTRSKYHEKINQTYEYRHRITHKQNRSPPRCCFDKMILKRLGAPETSPLVTCSHQYGQLAKTQGRKQVAHHGKLTPHPFPSSRNVTAMSANTRDRLVNASATSTSAKCTSVAGKNTPANDVKNSEVCSLLFCVEVTLSFIDIVWCAFRTGIQKVRSCRGGVADERGML